MQEKKYNEKFEVDTSETGKKAEYAFHSMVARLYANENLKFYANLFKMFKLKIMKDGKKRPDFDVGLEVNKSSIQLIINPFVFFLKDETERCFRLIHELEHVLRNDVLFEPEKTPGFDMMVETFHEYIDPETNKPVSYKKKTPLAFLAMDLAVNSLKYKDNKDFSKDTDFLLRDGIFPLEPPFEKFIPYQTWEWYYEKLLSGAKENGGEGGEGQGGLSFKNGACQCDGKMGDSINNSWSNGNADGELSEFDKENLKNFITNVVKEAIDQTEKSAGNIPGRYKQYMDDLKKIPYNWRKELKNFTASSICPDYRTSKRKINRRAIPLRAIAPGYQIKNDVTVVYFMDVSGSMGTEAFEQELAHAMKLRKTTGARVWVGTFDAEVQEFLELTKTNYQRLLKTKFAFTSGGTCFQPMFDKIVEKKLKPDALIIYTDGYACDNYKPLSWVKTLWVYPEGNYQKQNNGRHLVMKKFI